jgi:hypothetical protein
VAPALPLLARLLYSQDIETVTDACWAFSYLSDGTNDRIHAVLQSGVAHKLVELLGHPNTSVQTPALRTVGNIVTGTDEQTQFIINLNAIPALRWLLDHNKKNIRKEACWTLSNITAGTSEQIQLVINQEVFPKVIELLSVSEFDIQKEAAWAVSNATSGGQPQQIKYMVERGAIPPLCALLGVADAKIITVALEGLENILKCGKSLGEEVNRQFLDCLADCDGHEKIENLQEHENEAIYQRALRVLETYLSGEDETEDVDVAPQMTRQQFTFGAGGQGPGANVFNFGNQN